jgi:acetylornithine deacetylase/succinyl-diaminopimelate desuccinylase-like protein
MEDYVAAVVSYLDGRRDELLDYARQLIATPSMNPPGDERAMAEVVLHRLADLGLTGAETKAKAPNRPNILCRLTGALDGPTLMYNGHLDTKPIGDRAQWNTDPLRGEIVDGQLYGLGIGDMKAAVAAMVYAAGALRTSGVPLGGDLLLVFSADEEAGSAYGAHYLVEQKLVHADAAVLGEPSGVQKEWEHICLLSRGNACFRTKVWGTQMHSSLSDTLPSVNASAKMAYVLWRMNRDFRSSIHFAPHPLCAQGPTVNAGVMVRGGIFYGVYPGYAEFSTDLRTLPGMTQEGVGRDLEAFLNDLRAEDPALKVELEFEPSPLGWTPASEIAASHPIVRALQRAAEFVFGTSPPLGAFAGTTDATRFQFGLGIPTVPAFGPGRCSLAHGPNERVAVDSLWQAAQVYAICALHYLGVD